MQTLNTKPKIQNKSRTRNPNIKTNVLVTGAAGFIGSHLTEELLNLGYRVLALDDLSGGFRQNLPKKAEFIKGSILNTALLKRIFTKYKLTYVFHLAAYAAEGLSHFIKRFNYANNVIGSVNLINESIKNDIKCFVFTSSIAVYGRAQTPMKEEFIPRPEDSYGIAKFTVEQELDACEKMFGLNYIIFRPHNVYGEKQNIGDKYRNVIGIFMNNALQKKALPVFGGGTQTRAFSYIKDVCPIIAESVENKKNYNQIFNVGADTPYTINDLADKVIKAMGANVGKKYLDARNEVQHAFCDHSKVRRFFGERKLTSLEEGLSKMAEWVKKAGSRESKDFKDIEIHKNLPPSWLKEKSV